MNLLHSTKKSFLIMHLIFLFYSCKSQVTEPIVVQALKIHQDSITLRSELLPEFKVDIHDKNFQGNQISGVIRTVLQDENGDFWFGTQNGLCRYDKSGLVYFDFRDFYGQEVTVHKIIQDKSGVFWIGFGGGIAKYDGAYFTIFHEKNILKRDGLWSMTLDKKGLLWIGTTTGVYTFDGETLTPFDIPEGKIDPTKGISSSKMVHCIMEDSKGQMWFATNGGIYIYDGSTLKNISEKEGLQTNFASQIIERSDESYWISTTSAIFHYKGGTLTNITEKRINNLESVGCIFEDNKGLLWFSINKRDIYTFDGKSITRIKENNSEFTPFPFEIYQDHSNRMWFVGFKGAYRLENKTFINITRNGPW